MQDHCWILSSGLFYLFSISLSLEKSGSVTRHDATAQRFLGSGRVPRIFEASREGTENAARTNDARRVLEGVVRCSPHGTKSQRGRPS